MRTLRRISPLHVLSLLSYISGLDILYSENAGSPYCANFSTFTTELDHFSFDDRKIDIRVITDDRFYEPGGPVLFYTGNEGAIELFCENTGFQREAGKELKAKIIFMEHRYYGKSIPDQKNTFLTAEQALADYADFLDKLKRNTDVGPVIALGGSYGGMLAAYIRLKYPNIIAGSIAASAPVKFFPGQFDCRGFYRVTTRTFSNTPSGEVCADNIRDSWAVINQIGSHMVGKKLLSDTFKTCKVITDTSQLTDFLQDVWGSLAMMDYPYPTNFMGDVPGWPVNKACEHLDKKYSQMDLLDAIHQAAQVYYNYTGGMDCLDLGGGGDAPDLGYDAWYYQTCTEFVMPFCADGKQDMFMPSEFNFDQYKQNCINTFGTYPRKDWPEVYFNVEAMKQIGNIIFSNGHLDPWSSGGVLNQSEAGERNPIFIIDQGAHHLDLRSSNPLDPDQVKEVRQQYLTIIRQWIADANKSDSSDRQL